MNIAQIGGVECLFLTELCCKNYIHYATEFLLGLEKVATRFYIQIKLVCKKSKE